MVQVSPSLVKRQKTHFHDLPCGASVILGNNGFIWVYPTPEHKEDDAGGFIANLEVSTRRPSLPFGDGEALSGYCALAAGVGALCFSLLHGGSWSWYAFPVKSAQNIVLPSLVLER